MVCKMDNRQAIQCMKYSFASIDFQFAMINGEILSEERKEEFLINKILGKKMKKNRLYYANRI